MRSDVLQWSLGATSGRRGALACSGRAAAPSGRHPFWHGAWQPGCSLSPGCCRLQCRAHAWGLGLGFRRVLGYRNAFLRHARSAAARGGAVQGAHAGLGRVAAGGRAAAVRARLPGSPGARARALGRQPGRVSERRRSRSQGLTDVGWDRQKLGWPVLGTGRKPVLHSGDSFANAFARRKYVCQPLTAFAFGQRQKQ